MIDALVDTSYLVAISTQTVEAERLSTTARPYRLLIPQVVLVEATYFLMKRAGVRAALTMLDTILDNEITTPILERSDLHRVREIMAQYADAPFDFVDCCIMALAERKNIQTVLTLDRRDFTIFRPKHCEYLQILP
jgi:predicted nucleic acid-binding protein